jgi:hypothetical protein
MYIYTFKIICVLNQLFEVLAVLDKAAEEIALQKRGKIQTIHIYI